MSEEKPSKSARKREAHAIRALADELVALKPQQVSKVIDDADVMRSVIEAQAMSSHGALRRQKQYIARRLRDIDLSAIKAAMATLAGDPIREKKQFRAAEAIRDALLRSTFDAHPTILSENGLSDNPALQDSLARFQAAKTDAERKIAARQIFRFVHAALGELPVE